MDLNYCYYLLLVFIQLSTSVDVICSFLTHHRHHLKKVCDNLRAIDVWKMIEIGYKEMSPSSKVEFKTLHSYFNKVVVVALVYSRL